MNAETSAKHKFAEDAGMTFQEVYDFAYKGSVSLGSIPLVQSLANELGEERCVEILKTAASEAAQQGGQDAAKDLPDNGFAAYKAIVKALWAGRLWKHALTLEIVEDTDEALEVRVTECLWAKTFREGDASDIGYATLCHPDYAHCHGFNPKIRMIRTKTLMQGDDCCNHRWVWEEQPPDVMGS